MAHCPVCLASRAASALVQETHSCSLLLALQRTGAAPLACQHRLQLCKEQPEPHSSQALISTQKFEQHSLRQLRLHLLPPSMLSSAVLQHKNPDPGWPLGGPTGDTWRQGLFQLLCLLLVCDDQGVKVAAAAHLELHIVLVLLDLDGCRIKEVVTGTAATPHVPF